METAVNAADRAPTPDRTAAFDAFYRASRDRLLLQTYALTGDLGAARSAVRDAFVVAWHHWRKVGRLADPESSVRPHAWRQAQRRATVRPWHREKDLDDDNRATLAALASLTAQQRRALLLSQLATVSMEELAREMGLPSDTVERELQSGAAQFAIDRDIPSASIPLVFAQLAEAVGDVTWPRVTIIRRAGAARRRTHTFVGAASIVAVLVASGVLVTDATGVRPTLAREPVREPAAGSVAVGTPELLLPANSLLPETVVRDRLTGSWQQGRTHDNSVGNGVVLPCQPAGTRYADPRGVAAWVRAFHAAPAGRGRSESRRLTEVVEASRNRDRADRTYDRVRDWVAGCATPGFRLVETAEPPAVGDDAALVVLHDRHPASRTYVVGVARTGIFTTALALETDVSPDRADRSAVARLLGQAVERLCVLPEAGRCAREPVPPKPVAPYPVGEVPAMLATVDLPFIGNPAHPWMGTPPREVTDARTDIDVLGCVQPSLAGKYDRDRFRTNLVRTFVKVDKSLPDEFGLTEVVASLPRTRAGELLRDFRIAIDDCPDRDAGAGTDVRVLGGADDGAESFTAWHLSTRLPNERTVEASVAFLRSGSAVAQLVFVSAPGARMTDEQFLDLSRRALVRLPQLPPYDR